MIRAVSLGMGMRRVFVTLLFVSLGLSALTGCHPQFTGTLANRDGNGNGPSPAPGQPQVTSVSPGTAVAGAASFTLTVNGLNFVPTTTVLWNDNVSLTTTYVSSTVLKAEVPASLIASPTTVGISPSPLVTINFGVNFTITAATLTGNNSFSVSKVPIQANDIAWDQKNQQFYLSVASGNATNPNTITALDPQTGVLGSSVSTGSEPGKLAISTDSTYIYAGLNSAGSVHRYTLPALQSDIDIPLGSGTYGPYYAIDVEAEPGSSRSVAVSRGAAASYIREVGGILIYDDAVARPQSVPGFGPESGPIDSLVWNSNGQSLYGINTEIGTNAVYIMSANATGVQLQTQSSTASTSFGNYLHFDSTTGYIYTDSGKVIDPATGAVISSFPVNALQGGFNGNPIMVPDGKLNIAYFLGQTNGGGPGNYVIEAFDLTHFNLLGAIPITNASGTPSKVFRWGSNGLAFLTGGTSGAGAVGGGVYLVSGGFVTSPAP
jgi:hypothetical protein